MVAKRKMSQIEELRSIGLTDEEIRAVILKGGYAPAGHAAPPLPSVDANGHAGTAQPAQNAHQRQDGNLKADPEMVARLEAFRATHKPAVLEEVFEVTLKKRYVDYVNMYAAMINARRPNSDPIGPAKAIELIVMAYRIVDPDRALMEGARGRTAPAALPPGTWAQKTA